MPTVRTLNSSKNIKNVPPVADIGFAQRYMDKLPLVAGGTERKQNELLRQEN
jgi:hypothetical protein